MVLHADEYALQQQKEKEGQLETKLAKEYGLSVEEYRAQKNLLAEASKTVNSDHDKVLEQPSTNHDYQNLCNLTPNSTPNFPGGAKRSSHFPILSDRSPLSSLPVQTTLSNDPPTQDPSQFAIGSMISVPTQRGEPLHGVVMWIGTLPEFPGVIAGVELVSHIALIH